eukprot:comp19346_c1_seq1/m.22273 comp19346_c1_seq1/g.22273  ORF comp19346_c1_seq1/g.22273 comp19346_c1_seq1/m.22273 type:complete len:300 (+) comp19346_c1_seq1:845-1744(+)
MDSVFLVLGLGGSNGHVRMAIFASVIVLGICGWLMSLSTTTPRTSIVSSILPPTLPSILMSSKSTSRLSRSATLITASTAMRAICSWHRLTIFEPRVVIATLTSGCRLLLLTSMWSLMLSRWSLTILAAISKPSAIRMGWMPLSSRISLCSSSAPASTTTPVVPSPISSSCDCDSCTSSFAIWCCTSIFLRIVAPSFVMVTSPSGLTRSLSKPLGPSDVRRIEATLRAAKMCDFCASRPVRRLLDSWSLMTIKGRPFSSKNRLILLSYPVSGKVFGSRMGLDGVNLGRMRLMATEFPQR